MIRKALLGLSAIGLAIAAVGLFMYLGNRAPSVPALAAAEIADTRKPYVIKLHAQWCPLCMITKDVWAQIETTYGDRVRLLVLDFTNEANTAASRAEAKRLGLEPFFDQFDGATGIVVVLDGATRQVTASIKGSRDFAEYRTAIDAALAVPSSSPATR